MGGGGGGGGAGRDGRRARLALLPPGADFMKHFTPSTRLYFLTICRQKHRRRFHE